MNFERHCLNCKKAIEGRSDKKFCSVYCKSNYNYEINKGKENTRFAIVNSQLKLNRKILKAYNKAGKSEVRKNKLIEEGFNPRFFTNYWKNQKGDIYFFCYEYGFVKFRNSDAEKYILVKWQKYMNR